MSDHRSKPPPGGDRKSDDRSSEHVREAVEGILGGLGSIASRLGEVAKAAGEAAEQAAERQQTEGGPKVVYDVSVRMGAPGESASRPGSAAAPPPSTRAPRPRPRPEQAREPHAEISQEAGTLVVILDMPGVEDAGVEVQTGDGWLEVHGRGAGRHWRKRVEVAELTPRHEIFVSARNGVVRLEARPRPAQDDRSL